jgi:multidrug resistance efflux pump
MSTTLVNYIDGPTTRIAPRRRERSTNIANDLQQKLLKVVVSARSQTLLVQGLLGYLRIHEPTAVYFHSCGGDSAPIQWHENHEPAAIGQEQIDRARLAGQSSILQCNDTLCIAVPVLCREETNHVLVAEIKDGADRLKIDSLTTTLKLAATHITLWQLIASEQNSRATAIQRDVVGSILEQLADAKEFHSGTRLVAEHLAKAVGASSAALLVHDKDAAPKLASLSGAAEFDQASPLSKAFVELAAEMIVQVKDGARPNPNSIVRWQTKTTNDTGTNTEKATGTDTDTENPSDAIRLLTQQYSADGILGIPLVSQSEHWATVLIAVDSKTLTSPKAEHFLSTAATPISTVLHALQYDRSDKTQWWSWAQCRSIAGVFLIFAAITMLVPWPYQVYCDVTMQPVTRRFVAAPFDGTLKECAVEPGQFVQAGELLAQLDGRDLNVELENLRAAHQKAGTQYATALADHEVAKTQQLKLDMKKLELDMQLVQSHLDQLDIHSPVSGVVVSGDLRRIEGRPLAIGQSMFEVAPTDKMVVEIGIPERDINYVSAGDEVTIRLNAFPGKSWSGVIERLHPRAELIRDEIVFVAEVPLNNDGEAFRPGLTGRANISGPRRPFGWNLFHRAFEAAAIQMGW